MPELGGGGGAGGGRVGGGGGETGGGGGGGGKGGGVLYDVHNILVVIKHVSFPNPSSPNVHTSHPVTRALYTRPLYNVESDN